MLHPTTEHYLVSTAPVFFFYSTAHFGHLKATATDSFQATQVDGGTENQWEKSFHLAMQRACIRAMSPAGAMELCDPPPSRGIAK